MPAPEPRPALEQLVPWFQNRISLIVEPDPPNGIMLDTMGAERVFGEWWKGMRN